MGRSIRINYAASNIVTVNPLGSSLQLLGSGVPVIQTGAEVFRQNEPGGLVKIYDSEESLLPANLPGPDSGSSQTGCAWDADNSANLSIISDSAAPFSPSGVLKVKWPTGLVGSNSPCRIHTWAECDEVGVGVSTFATVYHSRVFKLQGPPGSEETWETGFGINASVGKLWGFIGGAQDPLVKPALQYQINNQLGGIANAGSVIVTEIEPWFNLQEPAALNRAMFMNDNTSFRVDINTWYELELLTIMNTPVGSANGTLMWWFRKSGAGFDATATRVLNYTDVQWRDAADSSLFTGCRMDLSWSSNSGAKSRDDFCFYDHIYISAA